MFDFDHDGELDFVETMSAAGFLGAFADEVTRDSEKSTKKKKKPEKSKRESSCYPWDDDYDSGDDDDDWDYDDPDDITKVDASDAFDVMEAVTSSRYDWDDIETLVEDALDNGAEFSESDVEEICRRIFDLDLKFRLRCSVKDRQY